MSMFYNDLEEEQAKYWTARIVPQSAGYAISMEYI